MEKLVSLKIIMLHGESFISDPFYCPFFKHYFDDYSNLFWYKSICSTLCKVCAEYSWGTPVTPVKVRSTSEAHNQYPSEIFNE